MPNYKRTKFACYSAYLTMASIFALPPLLFVTFHESYGVSYTLLGTLVLVNFCTQLGVDLAFTFFSRFFNPKLMVRVMPIITAAGLALYAFSPTIFGDNVYIGFLIATVIFSVSAGLSEVLLSPTVAALPSDNPARDMSLLHSLYGVGVFGVIVISTIFFKLFGSEKWAYLTLFFAALPIFAAVLFMFSPMPDMNTSSTVEKIEKKSGRNIGLVLCVACIFFGSCAENTMSNWVSGFMENALGIDKALGDILGTAMFAVLLATTRILYAKFGKNIKNILMIGMIGAVACYLLARSTANIAVPRISPSALSIPSAFSINPDTQFDIVFSAQLPKKMQATQRASPILRPLFFSLFSTDDDVFISGIGESIKRTAANMGIAAKKSVR